MAYLKQVRQRSTSPRVRCFCVTPCGHKCAKCAAALVCFLFSFVGLAAPKETYSKSLYFAFTKRPLDALPTTADGKLQDNSWKNVRPFLRDKLAAAHIDVVGGALTAGADEGGEAASSLKAAQARRRAGDIKASALDDVTKAHQEKLYAFFTDEAKNTIKQYFEQNNVALPCMMHPELQKVCAHGFTECNKQVNEASRRAASNGGELTIAEIIGQVGSAFTQKSWFNS